jgi:hypothetical protein
MTGPELGDGFVGFAGVRLILVLGLVTVISMAANALFSAKRHCHHGKLAPIQHHARGLVAGYRQGIKSHLYRALSTECDRCKSNTTSLPGRVVTAVTELKMGEVCWRCYWT